MLTRTDYPLPALDVRGDGGYVILPPSVTDAGCYAWIVDIPAAPLPAWLRELLAANQLPSPRPDESAADSASGNAGDEPRVRAALNFIPASSRDTWRDVGFAIKAHFGESGWPLFDAWSRTAEASYDERENRSQWVSFKPAGAIKLGTLFHLAEQHGWRPSGPRLKINAVAREYLGVTEDLTPLELPPAVQWPAPMNPDAFRGLAGDVGRAIDPHTEADPAAVLILFLAAFGNTAGASAHFLAEARPHPLRLWPVLVGETAKGRKGSAWSSLRFVLEKADPLWCANCTTSGLSSGEGLIWRVRDPITRTRDGTTTTDDKGVPDKRLLAMEEEFSSVLKVAGREGNTISDLLRRAWDHGNLATLTKNSPARATGAHVTVAGHITRPELTRLLSETDGLNGFGNRFLWLAVRRSKLLPEGGALASADVGGLVFNLRRALDHVRTATLFERTPAARHFWRELYPVLTADRPGLLGAITNRAEAYVMRLAVAYAALDLCRNVDVPHIQSALAVWDFCQRSAAFIFGESLGDRVADRILDALRAAGTDGLRQGAILDLFNRNISGRNLAESLGLLERLNLARRFDQPPTGKGGRPPVIWQATPYELNEKNEQSASFGGIISFNSFFSSANPTDKPPVPTWLDGSPVVEPPDDLPPVDADGNLIVADEPEPEELHV